tara:strand:+ start:113 stop:382 length:270 start_codon:yes stop_codon:yes gene_type:complete
LPGASPGNQRARNAVKELVSLFEASNKANASRAAAAHAVGKQGVFEAKKASRFPSFSFSQDPAVIAAKTESSDSTKCLDTAVVFSTAHI